MTYDPRYVYLYPASIPQIVAHIQEYLRDNPITSTATITQLIINELSEHPEILNGAEIPITAEDQQSIKDYIDHLPSVDGYTKEQVNALLDEKQDVLTFDQAPTPSSSNPVTSSGISTAITTAITTLSALINLKANLSDVYTKSVIDQLLSGKANVTDVYTKTVVDTLLGNKANAADVYTKIETNQLLTAKANAADVYTKTETDTLLNDKADETEVTDLKSALNIINPPLDITWTLGAGINSSGVEYNNTYTAITNVIPVTPGDVFATDSPTTDSNGKFLVYYVCEYADSVFKKRTEFTSSVRSVVIGDDTDSIRVVFGRYGSSGIAITQTDIDTYVSVKFTQKAGAASLVKKLVNKISDFSPDTYITNKYIYQRNDVNNIDQNTLYFCAEGTANNPTTQGGYFIQTILYRSDAAAAIQIAYRFDNGLIYYRRKVTGTWRAWFCVSSHSMPSDPQYYAFGDSLTYGAVWTPKEEAPYYQITQASVANQIPTRIANAIGAAGNFQNKGVGGAYFVGTGNNKIISAIQNTDLTNAKIITVAGGRNDSENPLGDKNSIVGDGTICGAIKEILEYLTTTYKQLQIVWIGVTPNTHDNSTVFTRVFAGGWSLNTFDEKVSELCAEYGIPYVNWKECTYIRHWADFSGAGDVYSHPNNENSYLQMGNYIAGKVSAFYKG